MRSRVLVKMSCLDMGSLLPRTNSTGQVKSTSGLSLNASWHIVRYVMQVRLCASCVSLPGPIYLVPRSVKGV